MGCWKQAEHELALYDVEYRIACNELAGAQLRWERAVLVESEEIGALLAEVEQRRARVAQAIKEWGEQEDLVAAANGSKEL